MTLPNHIVCTLLEEWNVLLEDRIDDLVKRYAQTMKWTRSDIENMARFDPSRNKKYLAWIAKEASENALDQRDLDGIHDLLMEFERLIAIPAFQGSRDLYSYTLLSLQQAISDNSQLRSQSEIERKAKQAKKTKTVADYEHKEGVETVAEEGDLTLLKITNAESLAWWAWRGYMEENPNWGRPTIHPPPPGQPVSIQDRKWCVRNTTHGTNYLKKEPFYLVLKKGWPYVGVLIEDGQVKNLDNDQVDMGVAEEIYPLLSPVLEAVKARGRTFGWETRIFENMRFLHGGVREGERFSSEIDLSGSSLSVLPPNLTFEDSLDVSGTKLQVIPEGTVIKGGLTAKGSALTTIAPTAEISQRLDVSGTRVQSVPSGMKLDTLNVANTPIAELPEKLEVTNLNIEGTRIADIPSTVRAKRITYSEPLTLEKMKLHFMDENMEQLRHQFDVHPKFQNLLPAAKRKAWTKTLQNLKRYYLTDPVLESHIKTIYVHRKSGSTQ